MFGEGIAFLAIVVLVIVVWGQQRRLRVLEFDLDGLRKAFLTHREAAAATARADTQSTASDTKEARTLSPGELATADVETPRATDAQLVAAIAALPPDVAQSPHTAAAAEPQRPAASTESPAKASATPPPTPSRPVRPTMETALGTRWAVWVGGLALALGGIFLVRYTIEAGIFGPEVRLVLAALLGIALVAAGEVVRRTGFRLPIEGIAGAYVPGILTAAGAFTLFGTVYAAHGIYGFVGPATAFTLLGAIGIATIVAALVHGQALAGVGIVGSYVTPILVSSEAPNLWALFGFIAIVLAAAGAIARLRDWSLLMGAAFLGSGLWTLGYLVLAPAPADLDVLAFIVAVTLAVLAFVWLARRSADGFDIVSIVPAFFVGLAAVPLFIDPVNGGTGIAWSTAFLAAMLVIALLRAPAIALLHAAGVATAFIFLSYAFSGSISFDLLGGTIVLDGFEPVAAGSSRIVWAGIVLGAVFAGCGLWSAWRLAVDQPDRGTSWAGWAVAVPLVVLFSVWVAFGNLDRDVAHALAATALLLLFAVAGDRLARAGTPSAGSVWAAFIGAGVALLFALHMGFGPLWTTMLLGASAAVPAIATRWRAYPVLGWLSVGAAAFVLLRYAVDPTIVGAANLSTTPFLNALLLGYGVPALGAAFAAWQLRRTTNGTPRLVMEAAATFFALIGAAMLTRHAMHGGVIDTGPLTLAEQSIYTLIALAGSAILIALDLRAPSPVFRLGSIAIGVVSAAMIVVMHFLVLNPLVTDESTGRIPVLNLLLIAYLLPALAAGGLALFARNKRPRWSVAGLALIGALLAFAYATLSVRRLFHGEHIAAWRDFGQLETYSYSALWLALGVALLVAGMVLKSQVLRLASGALIVIAVAKVFLFDMSELEGVLRALSFIGLGVVLIGIGLFYQRMLRLGLGAPQQEPASAPPSAI